MVMKNRYKLYEPGKSLSHIHLNEDLTPARSTLTYRCRKSDKFRSVWTYDGETYVRPWSRDKNAKGDRLYCEADIAKYAQMQMPQRRFDQVAEEDEDEQESEEDEEEVAEDEAVVDQNHQVGDDEAAAAEN